MSDILWPLYFVFGLILALAAIIGDRKSTVGRPLIMFEVVILVLCWPIIMMFIPVNRRK